MKKVDADRHLVGVESRMLDGSYVDPARSRVTVAAWSATWLDAQAHLKPSTRARYEGIVGRHILPTWGLVPLSSVAHSDVAAWTTKLSLGVDRFNGALHPPGVFPDSGARRP